MKSENKIRFDIEIEELAVVISGSLIHKECLEIRQRDILHDARTRLGIDRAFGNTLPLLALCCVRN